MATSLLKSPEHLSVFWVKHIPFVRMVKFKFLAALSCIKVSDSFSFLTNSLMSFMYIR